MTIESALKLAKHTFRLTKTNELVFPICRTNKGNLGIKFTTQNDEFEIMLDAVPLPTKDTLKDENNIELKKMIEKYWFKVQMLYPTLPLQISKEESDQLINVVDSAGNDITDKVLGKKRGRPVGSKNKK